MPKFILSLSFIQNGKWHEQMKRGDTEFQYLENVAWFMWFGNRAVIIVWWYWRFRFCEEWNGVLQKL